MSGKGTAAIQAAVDAAPDGAWSAFGPARPTTVRTTSASSSAFVRLSPARLSVFGGQFTGVGNGISYRRAPSESQSYDFANTGVDFSTYLQIHGNILNPVPGASSAASISGTNGDDETWIIADNWLGAPMANTRAPVPRDDVS